MCLYRAEMRIEIAYVSNELLSSAHLILHEIRKAKEQQNNNHYDKIIHVL